MYGNKRPFNDVIDLVGLIVRFHMTPIEKAKQLGTFDKIDRSPQYQEPEPRELLRAVNEAWSKIRSCEKELTKKDLAIAQLREKLRTSNRWSIPVTSIITGLCWEGLKALFHALVR